MRQGIFISLFILIGFVLGGFAVELVEHYRSLTFDPKLSLGDVTNASMTLLAAVLVTVLVANYLEKHNQAERKEKELLLRRLDLIFPLVQDFEKSNENGNLTEIAATLKRVSVSCNLFNRVVKDLNYPPHILAETDFDNLIREIRRLATDTPIKEIEVHAKRSKCCASVKDGIITLTTDRKALLDGKVDEIKSKLLKVQIVINKM
jgi:hypothetical protein